MKFLFWNVRGIYNKSSRDILFSLYKQIYLDVTCLAEPMMSSNDIFANYLRSLNMNFIAFNLRDVCSKIWIFLFN